MLERELLLRRLLLCFFLRLLRHLLDRKLRQPRGRFCGKSSLRQLSLLGFGEHVSHELHVELELRRRRHLHRLGLRRGERATLHGRQSMFERALLSRRPLLQHRLQWLRQLLDGKLPPARVGLCGHRAMRSLRMQRCGHQLSWI